MAKTYRKLGNEEIGYTLEETETTEVIRVYAIGQLENELARLTALMAEVDKLTVEPTP